MDLSLYSGDSRNLIISVTDENNAPINLENATIKWILSSQNNIELTKSNGKGVTISNASQGQFIIALAATDTQNLSGNYVHAARVTTSNGESSIVLQGAVTITKALL